MSYDRSKPVQPGKAEAEVRRDKHSGHDGSVHRLPVDELLALGRWNTPTVFNGWEAITSRSSTDPVFNSEETVDYMPYLGPMVGYAVTVVIEPSNPDHPRDKPDAWKEYREYVASVEGPKIVVVQDLDKPNVYGAFWGEVNSNVHLTLGCVGSITDGGVRDLDEMKQAGIKMLARRLCVGHAYNYPVRWNVPVDVFGCRVNPGQLIHADQHGFMAIPDEDVPDLLHAAEFMDRNEFGTLISTAKAWRGKDPLEFVGAIGAAGDTFRARVRDAFSKPGEF